MAEDVSALTTAVKSDEGKPRLDLVPFDALLEVGRALEYGERKYAARNWEKGMAWGRLTGAAMRHLSRWMVGENRDPESGLHHLAHFACCALMLLALVLRKHGWDDRGVVASDPVSRAMRSEWSPTEATQFVRHSYAARKAEGRKLVAKRKVK